MQLKGLEPVQIPPDTEYLKKLDKNLQDFSDILVTLFKNGIVIIDNLNLKSVTVTTSGVATTETSHAHGLKRVPIGFIPYDVDKIAHVVKGTTAHDATNIYVRSDVATVTAKLLVF